MCTRNICVTDLIFWGGRQGFSWVYWEAYSSLSEKRPISIESASVCVVCVLCVCCVVCVCVSLSLSPSGAVNAKRLRLAPHAWLRDTDMSSKPRHRFSSANTKSAMDLADRGDGGEGRGGGRGGSWKVVEEGEQTMREQAKKIKKSLYSYVY
jgi:hypothetical protein